jgi:hypothetical protein
MEISRKSIKTEKFKAQFFISTDLSNPCFEKVLVALKNKIFLSIFISLVIINYL